MRDPIHWNESVIDVRLRAPHATRVEVIDSTGRAFVKHYPPGVEISVQDDARTVKVMVDRGQHEPAQS